MKKPALVWQQKDFGIFSNLFEGPVVCGQNLLFTDPLAKKIYQLELSALKNRSRKAQPKEVFEGQKINGLTLDESGQLNGCRMSNSPAIVKVNLDDEKTETLSDISCDKHRFNSPNDLVWDSKFEQLFFTDPKIPNPWGKRECVYSLQLNAHSAKCCFRLKRPNGIAIRRGENGNPDYLYVSESKKGRIHMFEILGPGKVENHRILACGLPQPLDGMKVGPDDRLYFTSGTKVLRVNLDDGKKRPIPDTVCDLHCFWSKPSNLCFVDDHSIAITGYGRAAMVGRLFYLELEGR